MRTSEYYARGIYSFFVNYGLDAVERHHGETRAAEVEPEPELPTGRVNVIENPHLADFAYEAYRIATEYPCGFCACPGCYDCTSYDDEPCACEKEENQ